MHRAGGARILIKENGLGLKVQRACLVRRHIVGLPKPVLLKSKKLTIITDKIKAFSLYISNRYKYLTISSVILN